MPALRPEEIEDAYRRHGHGVLRRARRLLGDEHDATETLHEVFIDLLEHPEQFEKRSSLVTWLYAATTHRCLNRLRNGRSHARLLEEQHAPTHEASPAGKVESMLELRRLLDSVSEEMAQAAVYHHMDELTQDEIAAVMGCSRRHVGHLLERLRARVSEEVGRP